MKHALGATPAAKRDALWALLLVPSAALQTFLISSLSWWHVPLVRLAVVGTLAFFSMLMLRRAVLRAEEWALGGVLSLGVTWGAAFLLSGLLGRDPLGVLFGFIVALIGGRWVYRVSRRLRSAPYHSGARWYQGAPQSLPRVSVRVLNLGGEAVVESCRVARLDATGAFLLLPKNAELKAGEYIIEFTGADMQLHQPAHFNLVWERSAHRGAGFRFSQLEKTELTKPVGDWMNRLEGRGYEQMA